MLLASVKNRSNRPVMSVSICSGGMPEKNVATTTTGILIGGNRSTGMRATVLTPTTASTRQRTTIRYGFRIENLPRYSPPCKSAERNSLASVAPDLNPLRLPMTTNSFSRSPPTEFRPHSEFRDRS